MSEDWEANWSEDLLQQDNISVVKAIRIQTNKLRSDKGKLKPNDAESFEFSWRPKLLCCQEPEKSVSFKVNPNKRLQDEQIVSTKNGTKSVIRRGELNDKDSYDILKNLSSTYRSDIKMMHRRKIWKDQLNLLVEEDIEHQEQNLENISY